MFLELRIVSHHALPKLHQISSGLIYVHREDVVHGDLSGVSGLLLSVGTPSDLKVQAKHSD